MVKHYQPRRYDYPEFEDSFRALLRDAEAAADAGKHAPARGGKQPATANGVAVSSTASACFCHLLSAVRAARLALPWPQQAKTNCSLCLPCNLHP